MVAWTGQAKQGQPGESGKSGTSLVPDIRKAGFRYYGLLFSLLTAPAAKCTLYRNSGPISREQARTRLERTEILHVRFRPSATIPRQCRENKWQALDSFRRDWRIGAPGAKPTHGKRLGPYQDCKKIKNYQAASRQTTSARLLGPVPLPGFCNTEGINQ